jgi:hypothetical protein
MCGYTCGSRLLWASAIVAMVGGCDPGGPQVADAVAPGVAHPLSWSASFEQAKTAAGSVALLVVRARIAPGW